MQDELGYLLVIPEGNTASDGGQFWNATPECCDSDETGVDDVGYLVSLIDEVQQEWGGGEVYLIGHSNGGFMGHRFVCDEPGLVSGIVALAGSSFNDPADCGFDGALSVVLAHGTADETVPYEGFDLPTYAYPGARELAARWVSRLACDEAPAEVAQRDYETSIDGEETATQTWTGCADETSVALWTIEAGIHIPSLDSQVFTRDALTFVGLEAF
ncbi:MAG: polyhydroxybutyrate depolymerase [Bradymonadia bacterium]